MGSAGLEKSAKPAIADHLTASGITHREGSASEIIRTDALGIVPNDQSAGGPDHV